MADVAPQGGTRSTVEVERKYDVERPDAAVPDLTDVPGVASVTAAEERLLEAVYYDTADRRLRVAGITLRHRTGGTDAGWHLKLPAGRGREEVTADGGPGEVPPALVALVRSRTRSARLEPVADPDGEDRAAFAFQPPGDADRLKHPPGRACDRGCPAVERRRQVPFGVGRIDDDGREAVAVERDGEGQSDEPAPQDDDVRAIHVQPSR